MWGKILKVIKNPLFILSILLILGLILRLLDINKTSFWYDEAFTGDVIKLSWKEMFSVIAADKVHPPLFYVLIRCWSLLFGVTQFSLRGFSVFFGLGSIAMAYLVGKDLFSKNKYPITGIVLATVVAISPFFVAYSNEARAYSFLAFLALGFAYTTLKFLSAKITKGRIKFLIFSILLAVILCSTHYLQIVYVIAVVCAGVIYKLIYTEEGVNKKGLFIALGVVVIGVLALMFLPLKQFVSGLGISGMWWIGEVKWYEVVRVYYSYFLGVVRYSLGVPPVRELLVSVPTLVWGGIMFGIHAIGYIFILVSKKIEIEEKRKLTFFFFLSMITFAGFYILGLLGFNSFVERYTIAGGIILLISFWMVIASLIKKWYLLIPVGIYLCFILMLKPMPSLVDYRDVAKDLDNLNNVQRYVFVEPLDLINASFYMDSQSMYYFYETEGQYSGWALLKDTQGIRIEDIRKGDILIVPSSNSKKFETMGLVKQDSNIEGIYNIFTLPN